MVWLAIGVLLFAYYINSKLQFPYSRSFPETRADLSFSMIDGRFAEYIDKLKEAVRRNFIVYNWEQVDEDTAYTRIYHLNAPHTWQKVLRIPTLYSKLAPYISGSVILLLVDGLMRAINHGRGIYALVLPTMKGRIEDGERVYACRSDDLCALVVAIGLIWTIRSLWERTQAIQSQTQGYLDGYSDGYTEALNDLAREKKEKTPD